jgi:hypothetical protein
MKDGRGGKWAGAALVNGYSHYDDNMPHDRIRRMATQLFERNVSD